MTTSHSSRSRLALVVIALAVTTSLAACTGGGEPDPDPSPTASPSASADAAPGLTEVQEDPGSGSDGEGGGFAGALADSDLTACERSDGGWTVSGTVANPTDAAADYRIYVSLLAGGGDTRALVQVDADGVAPAASAEWSTDIAVDEDDLECVLRVERYAA